MTADYLPAITWDHGLEDGEPNGVRAIGSNDVAGAVSLQIRHNGRGLTARLTLDLLADLHRQAVNA